MDLTARVTANIDQFVQAMGRVAQVGAQTAGQFNSSFNQMNHTINTTTSGMRNILNTALGFAAGQLGIMGLMGAFNQLRDSIIGTNSMLETSELQFTTLMGSARQAKQHVQDLFKFAAETPFESGPIIEASRQLQVMGISTDKVMESLKLVGDAAAVSSRGINEVAFWFGRAYSMIQGGRPFGEAAMRLQEMGILSARGRNEMEALQKSGAGTAAVWGRLVEEFARFDGAMKKLSGTWVGLTSTIKDNVNLMIAGAFKPLFDIMKQGLAAMAEFVQQPGFMAFGQTVAAGIQVIIDGFSELGSMIRTTLGPVLQDLWDAISKLGEGWEDAGGVIQEAARGAFQTILELAKPVLEIIVELIPEIAELAKIAVPAFQLILIGFQAMAVPIIGGLTFLSSIIQDMKNNDIPDLAKAWTATGEAMDRQMMSTNRTVTKFWDGFKESKPKVQVATDAQRELAREIARGESASIRADKAFTEMKPPDPAKVTASAKAIDALADAMELRKMTMIVDTDERDIERLQHRFDELAKKGKESAAAINALGKETVAFVRAQKETAAILAEVTKEIERQEQEATKAFEIEKDLRDDIVSLGEDEVEKFKRQEDQKLYATLMRIEKEVTEEKRKAELIGLAYEASAARQAEFDRKRFQDQLDKWIEFQERVKQVTQTDTARLNTQLDKELADIKAYYSTIIHQAGISKEEKKRLEEEYTQVVIDHNNKRKLDTFKTLEEQIDREERQKAMLKALDEGRFNEQMLRTASAAKAEQDVLNKQIEMYKTINEADKNRRIGHAKLMQQMAIDEGNFFKYVEGQLHELAASHKTVWEDVGDLVKGVAKEMESSLSDLFFDVLTGKLDSLEDVFDSLWKSILRQITNFLASQAVRMLLEFFSQTLSGGEYDWGRILTGGGGGGAGGGGGGTGGAVASGASGAATGAALVKQLYDRIFGPTVTPVGDVATVTGETGGGTTTFSDVIRGGGADLTVTPGDTGADFSIPDTYVGDFDVSVPDYNFDVGTVDVYQRGGRIPGTGSGDIVPAMLEPGEFVVNKRAAQRNLSLLSLLNQQGTPAWKKGIAFAQVGGIISAAPSIATAGSGAYRVATTDDPGAMASGGLQVIRGVTAATAHLAPEYANAAWQAIGGPATGITTGVSALGAIGGIAGGLAGLYGIYQGIKTGGGAGAAQAVLGAYGAVAGAAALAASGALGATAAAAGATVGAVLLPFAPIMLFAAIGVMNMMKQQADAKMRQSKESVEIRKQFNEALPILAEAGALTAELGSVNEMNDPNMLLGSLVYANDTFEKGIDAMGPIYRLISTQGQGGSSSVTKAIPQDSINEIAAAVRPMALNTIIGYIRTADALAARGVMVVPPASSKKDFLGLVNMLGSFGGGPIPDPYEWVSKHLGAYSKIGAGNLEKSVRAYFEAFDPNYQGSELERIWGAAPTINLPETVTEAEMDQVAALAGAQRMAEIDAAITRWEMYANINDMSEANQLRMQEAGVQPYVLQSELDWVPQPAIEWVFNTNDESRILDLVLRGPGEAAFKPLFAPDGTVIIDAENPNIPWVVDVSERRYIVNGRDEYGNLMGEHFEYTQENLDRWWAQHQERAFMLQLPNPSTGGDGAQLGGLIGDITSTKGPRDTRSMFVDADEFLVRSEVASQYPVELAQLNQNGVWPESGEEESNGKPQQQITLNITINGNVPDPNQLVKTLMPAIRDELARNNTRLSRAGNKREV